MRSGTAKKVATCLSLVFHHREGESEIEKRGKREREAGEGREGERRGEKRQREVMGLYMVHVQQSSVPQFSRGWQQRVLGVWNFVVSQLCEGTWFPLCQTGIPFHDIQLDPISSLHRQ